MPGYLAMTAKMPRAVQEQVFGNADRQAPELAALTAQYWRVRDGLGYRKSAAACGAFPADPHSHMPGERGAQQPGMTGQVKEEVLTRWCELGLRMRDGQVHFNPVLLDAVELPADGALTFTWAGVPFAYRRGTATRQRVQIADGWRGCSPTCASIREGVLAVQIELT
ncbi:hypothetical protein [Roseateles sp.]|uniref:hypothetical protein n=1 Tax=Roseateles sp. TaxID=1971397 RepID=UPI00286A6AF2|nr:hypothetical protein [Roseateles sp.]